VARDKKLMRPWSLLGARCAAQMAQLAPLDHDDEDRELTPVVFDKIFLDTTAHTDSRE
jgi:hypothetical protein